MCWIGAGLLGAWRLARGEEDQPGWLGWARNLEKTDLGGITEMLLQGQRGAGTPRGSHRHGGGGASGPAAQVSSGC